ncbi:hypothetical protein PINS_up013418 [Pythium insidiosum]|nr:hypothetical protein PINS_up013418 [Pythium insidiosum]
MGSLLFGGGDSDGNNGASYLDERKTRRFKAQEMPEHTNPIVDKNSFYGSETAAQRERDRVTLPPGAVPRDALVVAAPNAYGRRGSNPGPSSSMSEYFSNGMGAKPIIRRDAARDACLGRRVVRRPSSLDDFMAERNTSTPNNSIHSLLHQETERLCSQTLRERPRTS